MKPSEMESHHPRQNSVLSDFDLKPSEKGPWPSFVTLICEFVRDLSPLSVTTKQKAYICNNFQVIVQTDTRASSKGIIYACVRDNCMTSWSNFKNKKRLRQISLNSTHSAKNNTIPRSSLLVAIYYIALLYTTRRTRHYNETSLM